jgi:tripartite-type tricarboxylate transporter receptor subunit TctC
MKRFFLVAAATLALCAPALAQSNYPGKPVKLIVDSAPGSATDVINRLVSERLAQIWGQQVLTLNYPGAGGSIAVRAASQAEPDGTTFFVGNASVFMALKGEPGVAPNLPVELPRDFTPIGFIAQQPSSSPLRRRPTSNRCLSLSTRRRNGRVRCPTRPPGAAASPT